MKIILTGAAGFIGSHLVDRLLAEGHNVVGIDNFDPFYPRTDKEENLRSARQNERFTFAEADIRSRQDLEAVARDAGQVDAIAHLAARAGVRPSLEDPAGYHETNVVGTANVLELARGVGRSVSQLPEHAGVCSAFSADCLGRYQLPATRNPLAPILSHALVEL